MKLTILFTAGCFLTSFLASCDSQKKTASTPDSTQPDEEETVGFPVAAEGEKKSCCSEHPAPEAVEASADSIYQLDSKWRDQGDHERSLKSLGGRVQVLTMGYSTCKFACPRLLADMRLIESGLSKEVAAKTGFTFVSIDPETDTPARLAEYQKENKIDPSRWTLLTGETSSVQELAVVLGVQYRKVDAKDFAHSNMITVLNAKGEIIFRQEGLAADPAATIKAITEATQ